MGAHSGASKVIVRRKDEASETLLLRDTRGAGRQGEVGPEGVWTTEMFPAGGACESIKVEAVAVAEVAVPLKTITQSTVTSAFKPCRCIVNLSVDIC